MRINVSKSGLSAALLVLLTILSLLFLLLGGDDPKGEPSVQNGQTGQSARAVQDGSGQDRPAYRRAGSAENAQAGALIAQAAFHQAVPSIRRVLGGWEAKAVQDRQPSLQSDRQTDGQRDAKPLPAAHASGLTITNQSSGGMTVAPPATGNSSGMAAPTPADASAAYRTGRQHLEPLSGGTVNASVAFKRSSDQLLIFAETLVLKSRSGKPASGGKPVLSSPDGLVFEESLTPSLADEVAHVDFALAQSLRSLGRADGDLVVEADEVRDEGGEYYHFKRVRLYAGPDVPLFINTLRDSMLAWADGAELVRLTVSDAPAATVSAGKGGGQTGVPVAGAGSGTAVTSTSERGSPVADGGVWQVFIGSAHTHSLFIYSGSAPGRSGHPGEADGTGKTPLADEAAPRLVIVLDDLGESKRQARFLLNLSYPVTFAVWPRSTHASAVAGMAVSGGAELIIHQPMEPIGYPEVNPGAGAMLFNMSEPEILAVLEENLKRVPGAQGLNNHMGSWLTQNGRLMAAVARELKRHDMFVLDSLTHARSQFGKAAVQEGAVAYRRDVFLDVQPEKEAVLRQLAKAEQIARLKGQAVVIGHPLPGTLAALDEWQRKRDKGINIVRLRDLRPLK